MATLQFKFKVGGIPRDVTSVVLEDPTGTFAIRRDDSGATVLATDPPVAMAKYNGVTGDYRYDFNPPQVGISYTWYAKVLYNGATYYFPRSFEYDITTPVSPYFSWTEFVNRWGLGNIAVASNKDNTSKTPNYDAVQDAFDYATEEVHEALRGGVLAIPLDFGQYDDVIPRVVRNWAMTIAFEYIYNGRGLDDRNKVGNKITAQLQQIYRDMAFYRAGLRQMNAAQAVATDGTAILSAVTGIRACNRSLPRWYNIDGIPVYVGDNGGFYYG